MGKMNELAVLAWNAGVKADFEEVSQLKVHVAKQLLFCNHINFELQQLANRFNLPNATELKDYRVRKKLAKEITELTFGEAVSVNRGTELYHYRERNADGTAMRVRVNGKCQTWKTRDNEFRLPVKYGLRNCLDITHDNAWEWFKL